MEFVLLHIPHIIPALVAMGFLGRFAAVMADQPPAEFSDAQIDEWRRVRIERARARRVRRVSARLGLLVAAAAGPRRRDGPLALHDRPARRPPVVARDLAARRRERARPRDRHRQGRSSRAARGSRAGSIPSRFFTDGLSLILAALAVPLLVTGVVPDRRAGLRLGDRLRAPVGSAWWMTLFGVHLMRYLGRSLDAALRGKAAPE